MSQKYLVTVTDLCHSIHLKLNLSVKNQSNQIFSHLELFSLRTDIFYSHFLHLRHFISKLYLIYLKFYQFIKLKQTW